MHKVLAKGFTLVELLLVIAIIGVLTGIVLMSLSAAKGKARDTVRLSDLKSIATALEFYSLKTGHYPVAEGWITSCDKPAGNWISDNGDYSWSTPYLPNFPHDPAEDCSGANPHTYAYQSDGQTYQITTQLEGSSPPGEISGQNYAFNGSSFQHVTDTTPITVSFSSSAGNPTNTSPIPVSITFSRAVSDFSQGVLSVLRGIISGFSQSLTTVYNVLITPTDNDVVVLMLNGGTVHDENGVGNQAAQFTITYDSLVPHVALSPDPLPGSVGGMFTVNANFTVAVVDFNASKISVQNGSAQGVMQTAPMNGTNYVFTVVPASAGAVSVYIPGGMVHSAANNANVGSNTLNTTYTP